MLQVGDKAPAFTLFSSDKKEVKLEDFQGQNVVLLFFPLAFTSVCTTELCTMRDDIAYYQGLNAQILGISVDSVFTLAKFKDEQHLNFPLLSDFNKIGLIGLIGKKIVIKDIAKLKRIADIV